MHDIIFYLEVNLMAQAVRRSPSTSGSPSLHLSHSMWVSWWTKRVWLDFSRCFSHFPLPQISFHHFSTLISSILFHFISPCDGAAGVVGLYSCWPSVYRGFITSYLSTLPCVWHELRLLIIIPPLILVSLPHFFFFLINNKKVLLKLETHTKNITLWLDLVTETQKFSKQSF